ncbi:hypothetical protein EON64_19300, partial [archaeon]
MPGGLDECEGSMRHDPGSMCSTLILVSIGYTPVSPALPPQQYAMADSCDYVAIALVLIYFLLFCAEGSQLVLALQQRNRIVNYRNGIMLIIFCAALLRVVFWVKVAVPSRGDVTLFLVIFYLPVWLNFAALSLLSVFYANAVYCCSTYSAWPWRVFLGLNAAFLALNVAIACLMREKANNQLQRNSVYALYIAYAVALDVLTALLVCVLGQQFGMQHAGKGASLQLPRPLTHFNMANYLLATCFLARSVCVLLFYYGVLGEGSAAYEVDFNSTHSKTSLS